jgi:hypothetical protein
MWRSKSNQVEGGRGYEVTIYRHDTPASVRDVIEAWQDDRAFRTFFIKLLADAPFEAYRWETPPVTRSSIDQPFEFVVVDDPALAQLEPDAEAFAGQFARTPAGHQVATFDNLGGDAILVAPLPITSYSAYSHLATFTRSAPNEQQHALWQAVGAALANQLNNEPTWLSTAGLGVPWLHVRLDSRPKYYVHEPYRQAPRSP